LHGQAGLCCVLPRASRPPAGPMPAASGW